MRWESKRLGCSLSDLKSLHFCPDKILCANPRRCSNRKLTGRNLKRNWKIWIIIFFLKKNFASHTSSLEMWRNCWHVPAINNKMPPYTGEISHISLTLIYTTLSSQIITHTLFLQQRKFIQFLPSWRSFKLRQL